EEHRRLNAMVADLREFLQQPRPAVGEKGAHSWSTELTRRLVRLHDSLSRHFQEEEEGGMMEELTEAHPRATGAVESLVHEHEEILRGLRRCTAGAMEYSDGIEPAEASLRRRLVTILDCLHQHEVAETDLIQRLEYEEIGPGD
ncbi:MAG: hemerythrin domain-containing protein, partial [Thermoanaerobaculia bacterium]